MSSFDETAQIAEAVARARRAALPWARLDLSERIDLLEALREGYFRVAPRLTADSCRAKGIALGSPEEGQEWLNDPLIVLRHLRLLQDSLIELRREGRLRVERSELRPLPNDRWKLRLFPRGALDVALLPLHRAWVHLQPGVGPKELERDQASFYQTPVEARRGRVCAVLGAGNVNAISPTDCLTKLFVEGTVCVLKTNPVNGFIGPYLAQAFAPLVERGALTVLSGGAEMGGALVRHSEVDEVHVTGSDKTYEALVWGSKKAAHPQLEKPVGAELGNITPVIVAPHRYSEAELWFQARNVAGMTVNNASFNCNAAKLLVLSRDWPQREAFLAGVKRALASAPRRHAYYPGAAERFERFTRGRAHVSLLGSELPDANGLPWALVEDVDSESDDLAFREEPWCAILTETALPGAEPGAFLQRAVDWVNSRVWGTLCATVISRPDAASWGPVAEAVDRLRYGTVAVNSWAAAVFALGSTPWGAYPGSSPRDIQSGTGWVHNARMVEGIEKVVLEAPLRTFPVPPWFPGHRSLRTLAQRLTAFERSPSWLRLPGLAVAALGA